jgi:hypothetical protein
MDYILGNRWHVVGLLNGDPDVPRTLCGARVDFTLGTVRTARDLVRTKAELCRSCDKATGAQASDEIYATALGAGGQP